MYGWPLMVMVMRVMGTWQPGSDEWNIRPWDRPPQPKTSPGQNLLLPWPAEGTVKIEVVFFHPRTCNPTAIELEEQNKNLPVASRGEAPRRWSRLPTSRNPESRAPLLLRYNGDAILNMDGLHNCGACPDLCSIDMDSLVNQVQSQYFGEYLSLSFLP